MYRSKAPIIFMMVFLIGCTYYYDKPNVGTKFTSINKDRVLHEFDGCSEVDKVNEMYNLKFAGTYCNHSIVVVKKSRSFFEPYGKAYIVIVDQNNTILSVFVGAI
ncbi:MAG: hypothetical protein SFY68_07925 [Candidatus Sumerlaeia bacterium]|nr:hypothetical protein [Candidatus Sumerlaeia bacterium]